VYRFLFKQTIICDIVVMLKTIQLFFNNFQDPEVAFTAVSPRHVFPVNSQKSL